MERETRRKITKHFGYWEFAQMAKIDSGGFWIMWGHKLSPPVTSFCFLFAVFFSGLVGTIFHGFSIETSRGEFYYLVISNLTQSLMSSN